jgi:hypothetical protein
MTKELLEKLKSITRHNSITDIDARTLYAFALMSRDYGAIVEIGSAFGYSSIVLASATDKNVYCIDPWTNDAYRGIQYHPPLKDMPWTDMDAEHGGEQVYEQFLNNTKDFKNIQHIRGTRNDYHSAEKIGMVFVDGDHHYDEVVKDLNFAKSLNPKFILVHDCYYKFLPQVDRDILHAMIDAMGRYCDYLSDITAVYIMI